jgi:hypothetical protein
MAERLKKTRSRFPENLCTDNQMEYNQNHDITIITHL